MLTQSKNRYRAFARIFWDNPKTLCRFILDYARNRAARHQFVFGDIRLSVRTLKPDIKVVRSSMLGEFDEAMAETDLHAHLIVDAGGYIGLASILFAKRFPNAQIVCLEPSTENFAIAHKNCSPYANITVLNVALGAESGRVMLRDRGTGHWGFSVSRRLSSPSVVIESVQVITLNDLLRRFNCEQIDLLKLDIEGAEYELFEEAESWIDFCSVLIVELHERICPGVERLYEHATERRRHLLTSAEKRVSVRI